MNKNTNIELLQAKNIKEYLETELSEMKNKQQFKDYVLYWINEWFGLICFIAILASFLASFLMFSISAEYQNLPFSLIVPSLVCALVIIITIYFLANRSQKNKRLLPTTFYKWLDLYESYLKSNPYNKISETILNEDKVYHDIIYGNKIEVIYVRGVNYSIEGIQVKNEDVEITDKVEHLELRIMKTPIIQTNEINKLIECLRYELLKKNTVETQKYYDLIELLIGKKLKAYLVVPKNELLEMSKYLR